ncbi:MAG: hypothetical protein IK115_07605 [Lachnospiraceae bacterium]|nr:hypothetical protein [Lachnospiraceae bacterium]
MDMYKAKGKLLLLFILLSLTLCACGMETCDFCGEKKFCKQFDILGVTRFICNDCLNNPLVAVSGNMVRTYSEKYEDGTLEYPEGSPLRADAGTVSEDSPSEAALPSLTPDIHVENPEPPFDTSAIPNGTEPTPVVTAPTPTAAAAGTSGSALTDALNAALAADNMLLVPKDGEGKEFLIYSGNNDLHLAVTRTEGSSAGKDGLVVAQNNGASSSDYVKAAIRSILTCIQSEDYDGLGHDIYNQAIQKGEFRYNGVIFRSTVHTADEVEKGAPVAEFSILP